MLKILIISIGITAHASSAQSSDLALKCSAGWLSSHSVTKKGDKYFLNGEMYPGYSEKINSRGKLWAKVRNVKISDDEIIFVKFTKNVKTKYVSRTDYFILNRKNLSFTEGVDRKSSNKNAIMADWFEGSDGACKRVNIN